ncbi:MAG: PadR family transcriptional regulator, partial [Agathobacter sp.]|nr:PadR family transcriptional regulator [Agathobacter sp.]
MQETEEQLHRHTSRLKHLQNSQTKFTAIPDSSSDKFGDYLVLLGAIMREEMM